MVDAPAHAGLSPVPLQFHEVHDEWARRIAEAAGGARVERAVHPRPPPRGYYRITPANGARRLFGKVAHCADVPRLAAAQELSDRVAAAGIPAQRSAAPPLAIGGDYTLLLGDWIEGRFSARVEPEMDALGTTVSRLHRFLVAEGLAGRATGDWAPVESLAASPRLSGASRDALEDLLRRRDEVCEKFAARAQPIHNDLHAGNVLFDARGGVAAVLDFEEALHSLGSPAIDLSWVLERFCFAGSEPSAAERLAARFLHSYRAGAGSHHVRRGTFADSIQWRSFMALAVLSSAALDADEALLAEWRKFEAIVAASRAWRPALERLEALLGR